MSSPNNALAAEGLSSRLPFPTMRKKAGAFVSHYLIGDVMIWKRLFNLLRLLAGGSLVVVPWLLLSLVLACNNPLVVVLSGSMMPTYYRGDILLVHRLPQYPIHPGDTVVYKTSHRIVPIVHRVHRSYRVPEEGKYISGWDMVKGNVSYSNTTLYRTKGDYNKRDDVTIYVPGTEWLEPHNILGKVLGAFPIIGFFTLLVESVHGLNWVAVVILLIYAAKSMDEE